MTGRCICCDLPVESCGKAAEQRFAAEAREVWEAIINTPGWLEAHYGGACERCREWYAPGDPITRWQSGWASACCFEIIQRGRGRYG